MRPVASRAPANAPITLANESSAAAAAAKERPMRSARKANSSSCCERGKVFTAASISAKCAHSGQGRNTNTISSRAAASQIQKQFEPAVLFRRESRNRPSRPIALANMFAPVIFRPVLRRAGDACACERKRYLTFVISSFLRHSTFACRAVAQRRPVIPHSFV